MKLFLVLLVFVFCLAFLQTSEAQDQNAGDLKDSDENLITLAARRGALASHLQSAQELRAANELLKAAQFLNRAGHLQLKLYVPEEALLTFQQNLELTIQINDPRAKVDALNGVASAHLHKGEYEPAVPALHEAISIGKQNNYVEGQAEALLLLAEAENHKNHEQAEITAKQALEVWERVGNNRGIIRSYLAISTYQFAQNELEESARNNETAFNRSRTKGFKDLEVDALINVAFIEYRKGAWHHMFKPLWEAEKMVNAEAEPFKMTRISSSIAEAYIESGLPETGLQKYDQALKYIRLANKPRDELVIRSLIGRALFLSRRYSEAVSTLEETLADPQLQKYPSVMGMYYDYLGRTRDAMGDHAGALNDLETAFNLYSETKNTMEAARTRARIGQIYEMAGRLQEGRDYYQQAMQTFDARLDRVNQSATLFALGRLEMKSGNYDLAQSYLRKSIDATENMRRMSTSRDLTAAFSATVHDRYELYIRCLMVDHRDGSNSSRVALAFETSESARARSLAELLRINDTILLGTLDPALAKKERSLRQLLRVKEDERVALLGRQYEKAQLDKLGAELESLAAEYKSILETIKRRHPAFERITRPRSWDLRRIQEEVISDAHTVLLEYFLGSEQSFVWAIARNSIKSYELPSQSLISKAVQEVYDLLKERPTPETRDRLDQATKRLAHMILDPVAGELNKHRILVAADGALNYIPFQILPATAGSPEPLVASHEIINVPSASILGELRKEASRRGVRAKVLAAFGNPIFAPRNEQADQNEQLSSNTRSIEFRNDNVDPARLGRLFHAGREIENLREVATNEQTFAATERDATRAKLLSMDLSPYSILHFATHGVLDPKQPEKSGLVLSTLDHEGKTVEGFVGLQDVYSLRAPVDLVVLSACETGLGKDIRGEGLVGLTRGFMYAGATSVVASLWKVEDKATAELMKRFYIEMLKNKKTPAEALRAAQNSIRQMPDWSAPHYWAGFTLQGEYQYVVNSERGSQWYVVVLVVGIALVLLVVGFLWYRHRVRRRYLTSKK